MNYNSNSNISLYLSCCQASAADGPSEDDINNDNNNDNNNIKSNNDNNNSNNDSNSNNNTTNNNNINRIRNRNDDNNTPIIVCRRISASISGTVQLRSPPKSSLTKTDP